MKKLSTIHILLITISISVALVAIGIITSDTGIIGNAIILSTFLIASPFLLIRYKRFRELKEMEERFPTFLRDLIETLRSGLPLHKAIINASKIGYGTLSKEVNKMAQQISWGLSVEKVLTQFAERTKSSKRINAAVQIILESYISGGDVIETLETVADTQLSLLDVEKEKSATLNQYVLVMYAISLTFIAIMIAMNRLMVPLFSSFTEQSGEFGISNPCNTCASFECSICVVLETTSTSLFHLKAGDISTYYTSIFFFMSLIQAIFAGLVAGEISEGSLIAGLRHSLILASITFGTFSILVRLGLLGT